MAVYFFQEESEDEYIKIGYSDSDIPARLIGVQIGNARAINVIGVLPDATLDDERQLHKRFLNSWVRGEWFKPTPDLLDFIKNETVLPEQKPRQIPAWRGREIGIPLAAEILAATFDMYKKAGGNFKIVPLPEKKGIGIFLDGYKYDPDTGDLYRLPAA